MRAMTGEDIVLRTISRLAATALVFTLVPGVSAQERSREFEPRTTGGWTFTPSFAIGGEWDSNVAIAGNRGFGQQTERDSLFTLEPQGLLEYRDNRNEFIGGYKGYVRRYVDIDELNGFDQRLFLSVQRLATKRLTLFVRDEYADVPSTDEVPLNGIPYARTGSKSNRFSGGGQMRLTKYDDLAFRYEHTWVEFDNPSAALRGGVINEGRVDYGRRLNEKTILGGEYRLRHAAINERTEMVWFHDFGGTVTYALGPHLSLKGAGGYSLLRDPRLPEHEGGAYFRGELTRSTEHITSGVYYERSFAPTFGFGGSSEAQELRGYVHMPFTKNRFYVQSSGAWRRTDPLSVLADLDLDTFLVDSTVGYAASRFLRIEGFHVYTRQDSRITGGEVNRHRVGAQLVISQPMRIR